MLTPALVLLPTIWIVDAAAGPGSHFTDIPAAIAAASSGDTILVRAGTYSAISINAKELTIRGAGVGATVVNGTSHAVLATPPGGVNVLAGLTIQGEFVTSQNARVTLLDCALVGSATAFLGSPALRAVESEVFALRCDFTGGSVLAPASGLGPSGIGQTYAGTAVTIGGSNFAAYDCDLKGGDNFANNPFMQHAGGHGLAASLSWARVDSCRLSGGNGMHAAGQGVYANGGSHVGIHGDAPDIVTGGTSGFSGAGPAIYVLASPFAVPSDVIVHGATPVLGTVSGPVTFASAHLPELTVAATTLASGETDASQPVTVTLDGLAPAALYAFLFDIRPRYAAVQAPFAGDLLLDLGTAGLFVGTLDGLGQAQLGFVPLAIFGGSMPVPVCMQFAVFDPSGSIRLSNLDARFYSL